MELWIRSQDKKCLIKANIIEYENYAGAILKGATDIDSDYHTLGKYKTKERALEVLDEIQDIITAKYVASLNPTAAVFESEEETSKALKMMAVYEMPEE